MASHQREYFVSSFTVPRFYVSLGQREVDLNQVLCDASSGVPVAGVTGMSGMGKSALASLLFQTRRAKYDKASFLAHVRDRSTEDVQRQLLVDLCGTVDSDTSKYAARIRQTIGTLRVLVVLDDVGSEEELEALQVSAFREERAVKKKSKAVVTGHDWQVMQEYMTTHGRIQIGPLDELDGMALFSHYAFIGAKVDKERHRLIHHLMVKDGRSHKHAEHHPNVEKVFRDFESTSMKIVHACAGNPLSIQVVGEFLGKKRDHFGTVDLLEMYKEALYKLNHAQVLGGSNSNDRLWKRLWSGFHDLDRPERDMFLDLAAFLDDRASARGTVSREAFLQRSPSRSPHISLQNLIDMSFVTVKPGGMLTMHNHFRAMGRKIDADREFAELSSRSLTMASGEPRSRTSMAAGDHSSRTSMAAGEQSSRTSMAAGEQSSRTSVAAAGEQSSLSRAGEKLETLEIDD